MSVVNAMRSSVTGLAGARAVVRDLNAATRDRFDALGWFYGFRVVSFPLRSSDTPARLFALGNSDNTVHPWLVTTAAADLLRAEGFGDWLADVLAGGGFRLVYSSEAVIFRARVPWQSVTVTGSAPVHLAKLVRGVNGYGVDLSLPLDPANGWAGSEFMRINAADAFGRDSFDMLAVTVAAPAVVPVRPSYNSSAVVAAFLSGSRSFADWRKLSRADRAAVVETLAVPPVVEVPEIANPVPVASLLSGDVDNPVETVETLAAVCPPADLVSPVAPVVPPLPSRAPVVPPVPSCAPVVPPVPSCAPSVVVPPLTHPGLPFRRSRKNKKRLSLPPLTAAAWVARAPSAGYTVENLGDDVYNLARRDVSLQVHLSGAVVFSGVLAAVYGGAPRRWLHAPVESDWLGRYLFDF